MVFNSLTVLWVAVVLFGTWTIILSFVVIRMVRHYDSLTKGVANTGLGDILNTIIKNQSDSASHSQKLEAGLKTVYANGKLHIQRVGIVRFNPFSDTGGAQSFTLALLDGHNNGIIMTSLHARTGNRWYVKEIGGGKGKNIELSKEEEQAIAAAQQRG